MQVRARALLLAVFAGLWSGCVYEHATVNLVDFDRRGVSLDRIRKRDVEGRSLGRTRASARSFLFGDCDALANRALDELLDNAQRTGGTGVAGVRFRGRWKWLSEPVCRRNFGYALLIFPAFFPVPMSATVSGFVILDPEPPASP